MLYLITGVFSIICFEIFKFLNFLERFNKIKTLLQNLIKIFSSREISDDQKQKKILESSKKIFLSSLSIILIIILISLLYYLINLAHDDFYSYSTSITGLIQITAVILIYFFIRKFFSAKL